MTKKETIVACGAATLNNKCKQLPAKETKAAGFVTPTASTNQLSMKETIQ